MHIPSNLHGTLSADTIADLIRIGLPLMQADGRVKYSVVEEATGVNYNRGWLIVRYAWLAENQPNALIDMVAAEKAARENQDRITAELTDQLKKAEGAEADRLEAVVLNSRYDRDRHFIGAIASGLRSQNLSWGEISVRMNLPEATIRRCFNKVSEVKDRGLRIGKGGRFAYDDPILYRENRKAEGAEIPLELKRKPKVEELRNYIPPTEAAKPTPKPKAPAGPKAAPAQKPAAPLGSRAAKREAAAKAEAEKAS